MFITFCVIASILNTLGLATFTVTYSAKLGSGCSIVEFNNSYLLSYFKDDYGPLFAEISSTENIIDTDYLHYGNVQGSETFHAVPCSLFNGTLVAYTYSINNIIWLYFVSDEKGYFQLTSNNSFKADATIIPTSMDETYQMFTIVWSETSNITASSYSLHGTVIIAEPKKLIAWSGVLKVDENIDNAHQLNSKIVKSAVSDSVLLVWREQNVIYGKIGLLNIQLMSNWINIQKFEIVSWGNNVQTEFEIYQIHSISVGGFVVLFSNDKVQNNIVYFVVLDDNGVNVYNKTFNIVSPFALKDPNWISFAQMVEKAPNNYVSGTYIKFIYSKYYKSGRWDYDATFYAMDWFFHLGFARKIYFYEKEYFGQHYLFQTLTEVPFCNFNPPFAMCWYYEYMPRHFCIHSNANKDGYVFAGQAHFKKKSRIEASFGKFSDSIESIPYICDSAESDVINDTFRMHGCYYQYPYYIGQTDNQLIYFNYSHNQYMISDTFKSVDEDVLLCNVSDIERFTNIMQCNGHWYSYFDENISMVTFTDYGCLDTTTASPDIYPPNVTGNSPGITTHSPNITSILTTNPPDTVISPTKNSASKISTTVITVVVIVVLLILIGIITYFIKKKINFEQEKKDRSNPDINEEQVNLNEIRNKQNVTVEVDDENVEMISLPTGESDKVETK